MVPKTYPGLWISKSPLGQCQLNRSAQQPGTLRKECDDPLESKEGRWWRKATTWPLKSFPRGYVGSIVAIVSDIFFDWRRTTGNSGEEKLWSTYREPASKNKKAKSTSNLHYNAVPKCRGHVVLRRMRCTYLRIKQLQLHTPSKQNVHIDSQPRNASTHTCLHQTSCSTKPEHLILRQEGPTVARHRLDLRFADGIFSNFFVWTSFFYSTKTYYVWSTAVHDKV